MSDLLSYVKEYLTSKKVSQKELSDKLGYSYAYISRILNGKDDINIKFLAAMSKEFEDFEFPGYSFVVNEPHSEYKKEIKYISEDKDGKLIPFYDTDVFATISPAMSDVVALRPSTFINIPMFSQGEYALQVTGHSMKGLINHGDWIVVKRIMNRNAIIYGEPYLVVTKTDNLKTVKFVKPSEDDDDSLCLIPYNIEQFDPQDIKKEEILEMYRVIGLFRST